MRLSEINRKTAETDISLKLNVDGRGVSDIKTGCGFLDHMLILFSKHASFDLSVNATGTHTSTITTQQRISVFVSAWHFPKVLVTSAVLYVTEI